MIYFSARQTFKRPEFSIGIYPNYLCTKLFPPKLFSYYGEKSVIHKSKYKKGY